MKDPIKDKYYKKNKEKLGIKRRAYYQKNKKKFKSWRRGYYLKNKEVNIKVYRNNYLKRTFNMSLGDYDKLLKNQNGLCAICGQPETQKIKNKIKSLAIDHNEETGVIRSLLCMSCNIGLGMFRENIDILKNAINYLIKHSIQKGERNGKELFNM